jgi:hypothetical protein
VNGSIAFSAILSPPSCIAHLIALSSPLLLLARVVLGNDRSAHSRWSVIVANTSSVVVLVVPIAPTHCIRYSVLVIITSDCRCCIPNNGPLVQDLSARSDLHV